MKEGTEEKEESGAKIQAEGWSQGSKTSIEEASQIYMMAPQHWQF